VVGDAADHRARAGAPVPLTPIHEHPWDLTPGAARALQAGLAGRIEADDRFEPIELVAGIDVGFEQGGALARAAIAVLHLPDLTPVDQAIARRGADFPYVPGLLSFREIPAVLDALAALRTSPQLLICDGQGLAHPRRFGLACHLGWILDVPCIGVAKSRLIGSFAEPEQRRGAATPLRHDDEVIGAALRSRAGAKPVFVSIGHRVGLASAIALAMACTGSYRLPETTRHAHRLTSSRLCLESQGQASGPDAGAGRARSELRSAIASAWPRCRPAPVPSGRAPPDASCS
jgi:deoxyribonuclease V